MRRRNHLKTIHLLNSPYSVSEFTRIQYPNTPVFCIQYPNTPLFGIQMLNTPYSAEYALILYSNAEYVHRLNTQCPALRHPNVQPLDIPMSSPYTLWAQVRPPYPTLWALFPSRKWTSYQVGNQNPTSQRKVGNQKSYPIGNQNPTSRPPLFK